MSLPCSSASSPKLVHGQDCFSFLKPEFELAAIANYFKIWFIHQYFLSDLNAVRDRNIEDLSGGELQRFACAVVCIQRADV